MVGTVIVRARMVPVVVADRRTVVIAGSLFFNDRGGGRRCGWLLAGGDSQAQTSQGKRGN